MEDEAHCRLLAGPDDYADALRRDLRGARERIWAEAYRVADDGIGSELGELMIAAARRGVDVRLIFDTSGSFRISRAFVRRLRAGGVRVRPWGRLAWLGRIRIGTRDHARLLIADQAAYTGGHNWANEWAPSPGGEGWHDISVRVEGRIVGHFAHAFAVHWDAAPRGDGPNLRGEEAGLTLLTDGTGGRILAEDAHVAAFEAARRRIWIAHAYFVPPRRFERALLDAARRGVDVRILVPGPTDLPVVRRAARADFSRWMAAGASVYEYQGRVMHSKVAVVDDWSAVGSYNAVWTSGTLALETTLVSRRPEVTAAVARQVERDLGDARQVAVWDRRRWWTRLIDRLARLAVRGPGWLLGHR